MHELTSLLEQLDDSAANHATPPVIAAADNQLIQVRLGVAGALFTALRFKDADTAAHSFRVTLVASVWAETLALTNAERDVVEVAALLHDVGKIGVPDEILLKPGALSPEEAIIMAQHRQMGLDIVKACCANEDVLAIVENTGAWFDGTNPGDGLSGADIPIGARMLSIVDAFDAMTADKVYRRALSRERAINELFRFAGTQFDPLLVKMFSEQQESDWHALEQRVSRRWLSTLQPVAMNANWELREGEARVGRTGSTNHLQKKLLDNMKDAIIFVDSSLRVIFWNRGAERLTGISASSIHMRRWLPSLLSMRNEDGTPVHDEACPLARSIRTGAQWLRRVVISGRNARDITVDAQAVAVTPPDGTVQGVALLLHDVSPEISLEARCQSLHEMATKDPLTQVANRAELDRVLGLFTILHHEQQLPFSLMIADIDLFKTVNDTYGHLAGDEIIKRFARLMNGRCRPGDLVARYGGEEFVMLCTDCDNAEAARRAEELRAAFGEIRHEAIHGRRVTASFGVTEIQPGDTSETMLRRADRALLLAKKKGRNSVVQLGSGSVPDESLDRLGIGLQEAIQQLPCGEIDELGLDETDGSSSCPSDGNMLAEQGLVSWMPLKMAIEKLRGFVADHDARIMSVHGDHVQLQATGGTYQTQIAGGEQGTTLVVDLYFAQDPALLATEPSDSHQGVPRTRIHIIISRKESPNHGPHDAELAHRLIASLRSYLIAS